MISKGAPPPFITPGRGPKAPAPQSLDSTFFWRGSPRGFAPWRAKQRARFEAQRARQEGTTGTRLYRDYIKVKCRPHQHVVSFPYLLRRLWGGEAKRVDRDPCAVAVPQVYVTAMALVTSALNGKGEKIIHILFYLDRVLHNIIFLKQVTESRK